jgi:hypothetical protein
MVYNLAELLTADTVSLLFTPDHSPYAKCWDAKGDGTKYEETENAIETLRADFDIDALMLETAYMGSTGSVALVVRQLEDNKVYIERVPGKECMPIYDPKNPNKLMELRREYPIKGADLIAQGYPEADNDKDRAGIQPEAWYFMRIDLDDSEETWYKPLIEAQYSDLKRGDEDAPKWVKDLERSWAHDFEITPAVFIKNTVQTKGMDGDATFGKIVDIIVEIDYLLSQICRGFRYSMDPILAIADGILGDIAPISDGNDGSATDNSTVDMSEKNTLTIPKDGKAEFLEINGGGLQNGKEFLKQMREWAIEVVGGMKSDQEHSGGAQSGKALEILHKKLIWLVDRLRICYGDRGLVPLLRILLTGVKEGIIKLDNFTSVDAIDLKAPIRLEWPQWNRPDGSELLDIMSAFELAVGGSQKTPVPMMSTEIAARYVAMAAGEPDPSRAVKKFLADREGQVAHLSDITKATNPPPPPKPAAK